MVIAMFFVRAESIDTRFDALVVLFMKEKALQVPEFVRVWIECGHTLSDEEGRAQTKECQFGVARKYMRLRQRAR